MHSENVVKDRRAQRLKTSRQGNKKQLTEDQEKLALHIARKYSEEARNPSVSARELIIAQSMPGSVNISSWGDPNHITSGMAMSYRLNKRGTGIDVIAQIGNNSFDGTDTSITPDDVWEFMVKYRSGP